jgi:hypothetical protein
MSLLRSSTLRGRIALAALALAGLGASSVRAQTPQVWAEPQALATEQVAVPCVCPFPQGYCPFPQGYCPPPVGPCAPVVPSGQMAAGQALVPVAPAPPAVVAFPPPRPYGAPVPYAIPQLYPSPTATGQMLPAATPQACCGGAM